MALSGENGPDSLTASVNSPNRAAAPTRPSKRGRAEEEKAAASASVNLDAARQIPSLSHRQLPTIELTTLAETIHEALAANDVRAVRKHLCALDNVQVTQRQLMESKIGVAVGDVLGNSACRALWPLSRAFISCWVQNLPEETLDAIRRLQQAGDLVMPQEDPVLGFPSLSSAPSSPVWGFPNPSKESPHAALTTTSPSIRTPTNAPFSPQRTSFYSTLCELLVDPLSATKIPSEVVKKVAKELAKTLHGQDERLLLFSRLRNSGLEFVRENLLSGRWTAEEYLHQPEEIFITAKEKEEEERRLRQKHKAFEEAKLAHVNLTNMFTCRGCKGKRCHYYEQQTRGADEPTTKFITCLDCKNVWTEE
ncbi:unnamed protein product [Phytomonas sp. Hart1]|nr:unnamed protein product [Phytomonas sp. Hart1]|eukprot:CCW69340.1 unnamed protein product [Phytomonas sp. isolate Hart1]